MSSGQYFDSDPVAPSRVHEVTCSLAGEPLVFSADRGVFAASRVDPGTLILLRTVLATLPAPPPAGDLLDLGCGYGPIAVSLARRSPQAMVWALDVNHRALALTAANAARYGCANVAPVEPDGVPDGVRFAQIWSNPPIRIGKDALHELLSRWLPRLAPEGTAWLVVQRHLGADSLAAWLGAGGWQVNRVASKAGYRVLEVRYPHGEAS